MRPHYRTAAVLAIALATGCGTRFHTTGTGPVVRTVGPPTLVQEQASGSAVATACATWRLSSEDVAAFFSLSEEISQREAMKHYYRLPCSISGRLTLDGKSWDYAINAAATATLASGGQVRHFGCSSEQCEKLVLLPTDFMDP